MAAHKSGFVNIVGLPNVGKSTLMNALTGERLSIITPKAQTTRHRIIGIVNNENYQVIFSDTPGYINQPAYKLQTNMNDFVTEALEDADVILFVTDKTQKEDEQKHLVELLANTKAASLVVINKMDLLQQGELEKLTAYWKEKLPKSEIMAVSASSGVNSKKVIKKIVDLLPEHPAYYDKDQLTDRNIRFFVAEIVREKIFLNYSAEIPYSCQVEVDTYEETEKTDKIRCVIYVERESQKMILIGKKGESLKTIGIEARREIEKFLNKQVYLELFIKVKDKWRNDPVSLKRFGFDNN